MRIGFLLWVGCNNDYNFELTLPERGIAAVVPIASVVQTDRITQVATPVVDALWVIDNSCSMADEQENLTSNFSGFIDYFTGSGLDYHVGVVSTDMLDPAHSGRLREVAGQRWIDVAATDPVGLFTGMATLGTTGTGVEKGLDASFAALEIEKDYYNAGFLREGSAIHTVTITDEKDSSEDISQAEFIDYFDGIREQAEDRSFSCIVTMTGPSEGKAYKNVATAVGGIIWDITDPNWPGLLDLLGIQVSGLQREFFLSALPVEGTIAVSVRLPNGIVQPFDEAEYDTYGEWQSGEWSYDAPRNSVTFLQYVPDALSIVELTYVLESSRQNDL